MSEVFHRVLIRLLGVVGPATGLMMLPALARHLLQHRRVMAFEKLKPDPGRLSLVSGFKRLFSIGEIINIIKQIVRTSRSAVPASR